MKKILSVLFTVMLVLSMVSGAFAEENTLAFGSFPQKKYSSESVPVEWLILEERDGKALLLSRFGLITKCFNEEQTGNAWENATIRAWLNDDFLNTAFTPEEQEAILITEVDNSQAQCAASHKAERENPTRDRIFLLSYHEAFEVYFGTEAERLCIPTEKGLTTGAWVGTVIYKGETMETGSWWLRTPGDGPTTADSVMEYGARNSSYVDSGHTLVRPALWVDLSKITK